RARFRWQDEIIAGQRTLGPARSIAGDGAANETWGAAFEPLVRETPFLQRAQPEIVNEHVGLIDKGCENLLPGRTCHVERDGALVAIHAEEISGLVPGEWGAPAARIIALAGGLDLDHICAHVAEHHGRERTRKDAREIDDANSGERAGCGWRGWRLLRHFDFLRMEGGALRSLAQPSRYSSSSRLLRMRNFGKAGLAPCRKAFMPSRLSSEPQTWARSSIPCCQEA